MLNGGGEKIAVEGSAKELLSMKHSKREPLTHCLYRDVAATKFNHCRVRHSTFTGFGAMWRALKRVGGMALIVTSLAGVFGCNKVSAEILTSNGESQDHSANESAPIVSITSGKDTFAAIMQDGSVKAWGNANNGGDQFSVDSLALDNVENLVSNGRALSLIHI